MANLDPEQQIFLVTELAMYGRPTAVAAAFKARYRVTLTRDQVHTYDAGLARNRERLSDELVALFGRVRAEWDKEVVNLSIFDKRWRGEELQKMYDALPPNAVKRRQSLLEQAAKESGDAFTNRRELTGKGGAPLPSLPPVVQVNLSDLTDEELDVLEKLHERRKPAEPREHSQGEGRA